MTEAAFNHGEKRKRTVVRINGPDPTFFIDTNRIEHSALAVLDTTMLDLLDVASLVFAADSAVSRGSRARNTLGAAWDRRFAQLVRSKMRCQNCTPSAKPSTKIESWLRD